MNWKLLLLAGILIVSLVVIGFSFLQFDTSIPVQYYRLGNTVYDFTGAIGDASGLFNEIGDKGSWVLSKLGILEHYDIQMNLVTFTNADESKYAYLIIWGIKDFNEGYDNGKCFRIYAYKDYEGETSIKDFVDANICYYPYTYEYGSFDHIGSTIIGNRNWNANIVQYGFSLLNRPHYIGEYSEEEYNLVSITPFDMREYSTMGFEMPKYSEE